MASAFDPALSFAFDDEEVHLLARLEHKRWMAERTARGFGHGPGQDGRTHADLVLWEKLPDEVRRKTWRPCGAFPPCWPTWASRCCGTAQAHRSAPPRRTSPPANGTPLQRAMMAADALVALARAAPAFSTGLWTGTRYADYEGPALEVFALNSVSGTSALMRSRRSPSRSS